VYSQIAICKRGSVRFAPKATEVLRCRELTRCARNGLHFRATSKLFSFN